MDKMNDLLEKYFRAETTISEEDKLKHYFMSDKVMPEHEMYRPLFETFEMELHETADSPLKKVLSIQRSFKRTWIQSFAYSGIAAALLITLWLQLPQKSEDYAIINGTRIDDSEYAQQYTEKKLNRVKVILAESMKPMQSLDKVRKNLQPIKKLAETKEKMKQIEQELNFKN